MCVPENGSGLYGKCLNYSPILLALKIFLQRWKHECQEKNKRSTENMVVGFSKRESQKVRHSQIEIWASQERVTIVSALALYTRLVV